MPASSGPRRQAPRASDAVEKVPVLSKVVRRSSRNPQRGKTRTNKPVTAEAERKPSAVIDMVQSSLGEDLPLGRRASTKQPCVRRKRGEQQADTACYSAAGPPLETPASALQSSAG